MRRLLQHMTGLLLAMLLASLLTACGGGGGEPAVQTTDAVIRATAQAVDGGGTPATLQTALGSTVALDASGSSASDGIAAYQWSISTRPAGSLATIGNATAALASFAPDVPGSYTLTLQVTGTSGGSSSAVLALQVGSAPPAVTLVSNVSFNGPSTTRATQAVAVGADIVLDATGSSDPSGGSLGIAWTLLSAPAGSTAVLNGNGLTTRLTPDLPGRYQVRARGTNPSGVFADVLFNFDALGTAPTVVVATTVATIGTSSSLRAAVGDLVTLDGAASQTSGGTTTGTWTLQGKPAASGLVQLTSVSATAVRFLADAPGTYILRYTLVDPGNGATGVHSTQVNVVQGPTAVVSGSSAPVVSASGPGLVGSVGSAVTLRGGASHDPSGEALQYTWALTARPAGSNAALASTDSADTSFTPDASGRYDTTLTVRNSAGLSATQALTVYVGSSPPVVALDRSQLLTLTGGSVSASAAASTTASGNALGYHWAIDARPAGSTAVIAAPDQAVLGFTPDVAGTYYATVTVSDGPLNTIAGVTIVALSATSGTVPLAYQPLLVRYSRSQGKAVIVAANPHTLHLVDPANATDVALALPAAVKSLQLSADGTLAAVLHEGSVSLVDLVSASLLRTSATGGAHSDAVVTNSGLVVVVGQTGGQWVTPGLSVIDGRTGATVVTGGGFASIYGTTRALLSEATGRLFTQSEGLSPQDIWSQVIDPVSGALGAVADSPYHGDYGMGNPLWLSADQALVFSASGNYFRTGDLRYAGTLGGAVFSLSQSASGAELVALRDAGTGFTGQVPSQYPAVYKRYTGALLFEAADVALPTLAGAQSHGLAIFHAADDRKVLLVQTGSSQRDASGLQYHLLLR